MADHQSINCLDDYKEWVRVCQANAHHPMQLTTWISLLLAGNAVIAHNHHERQERSSLKVIAGDYGPKQAPMVCARRGWRLARVESREKAKLCWAMRKAKIAAAWVGSVDGHWSGPYQAVLLEVKSCGNKLEHAVVCEQQQRLQKRAYNHEYCSDPIDNYVEKPRHHRGHGQKEEKKKRHRKNELDTLTPTVLRHRQYSTAPISANMTPMTTTTSKSTTGTKTATTKTTGQKTETSSRRPLRKERPCKPNPMKAKEKHRRVKSSTSGGAAPSSTVTAPRKVHYKPAHRNGSFHMPAFVEPLVKDKSAKKGKGQKSGKAHHGRGSSGRGTSGRTTGNDDLLSFSASLSLSASISAGSRSQSASVEFSSSLDEYIGGRHSFIHRFGRGARPHDIEKQAKGSKCIDGVQPIRRHRRRHFVKRIERSSSSASASASLSLDVDASVELPLLLGANGTRALKAAERPLHGTASSWPAKNNLLSPKLAKENPATEAAKPVTEVEPVVEAAPVAKQSLEDCLTRFENILGRLTQFLGRGDNFAQFAENGQAQASPAATGQAEQTLQSQ